MTRCMIALVMFGLAQGIEEEQPKVETLASMLQAFSAHNIRIENNLVQNELFDHGQALERITPSVIKERVQPASNAVLTKGSDSCMGMTDESNHDCKKLKDEASCKQNGSCNWGQDLDVKVLPDMNGTVAMLEPFWGEIEGAAVITVPFLSAMKTIMLNPFGGMLDAAVIGLLMLAGNAQQWFRTRDSHNETYYGELNLKGFDHFVLEQEGPFVFKGIPFNSSMGGKQVNPVDMILKKLLDDHLSEMNDLDSADGKPLADEIKTYIRFVANDWQDSITQHGVSHMASGPTAAIKSIRFLMSTNHEDGTADILFYSTKVEARNVAKFMVYQVDDMHMRHMFSKVSTRKYEIRQVPRDMTSIDLNSFNTFIDTVAGQAYATATKVCQQVADLCKPPHVTPSPSTIIV